MKRNVVSFRSNAKLARQLWGEPPRMAFCALREFTAKYSLSVAAGDLQFLDGRWYVTHSVLLRLAFRSGCLGIKAILQDKFSNPSECILRAGMETAESMWHDLILSKDWNARRRYRARLSLSYAVVADQSCGTLNVHQWIMSCRAFSRRI
jgi:hypothetical protein